MIAPTWSWIVAAAICAALGTLGAALLIWRDRIAARYAEYNRSLARWYEERSRAGLNLRLDPIARLTLYAAERRASVDTIRRRLTLVGILLLILSALMLILLTLTFAVGNDPNEQAAAEASFVAATSRPAPPGQSFPESLTRYLRATRGRLGFDVRDGSFVATRRLPPCDPRFSGCAPGNPDRVAAAWEGNVEWQERSQPAAPWAPR